MRRAIVTIGGTVAGLAALLAFKSHPAADASAAGMAGTTTPTLAVGPSSADKPGRADGAGSATASSASAPASVSAPASASMASFSRPTTAR
jgi:hypothetical protein